MTTIYLLQNDVLLTTNNGFDKFMKPLIPFEEYLEDCCFVDKETFFDLLKEIYNDEIKKLPFHMKSKAVSIIVDWKKNYTEKRNKYLNSLK